MNLIVYTGVLQSTRFRYSLSPLQASNWRRSIRRVGGFWDGSFTFRDPELAVVQDFCNQMVMGHIVEWDRGVITWEGFIATIDEPYPANGVYCADVTVLGYVHTLAWQKIAGAHVTDATGNVNVWISDIVTNHGPFIAYQKINTNTLQVMRSNIYSETAWDEISRVTEFGNASGYPWAFQVLARRFAFYNQVSIVPQYYTETGFVRRRSVLDVYNAISGAYTDENGADQTLAETTDAASIAKYGRRELTINRDNIPTAAITALRDTYLKEFAWPWPRVIGARAAMIFKTPTGDVLSPWQVRPGVVRDLSYVLTGADPTGWLADRRDTYIDIVEANESGISVKTLGYSESAYIEILMDYANEIGETDYDLTE